MIRSAASKVMWVGRATVFLVGLAVIAGLVFGVASVAFGTDGDFFTIGQTNTAESTSTLDKAGAGPALNLRVDSGAPIKVNSTTRVAKLNADQLDGMDASVLEEPRGYAHVADEGGVDDAYPSRGVNGVIIPPGQTSVYCFDLAFTPDAAVGSPFLTNSAVVATVTPPNTTIASNCPVPYRDAAAKTYGSSEGNDVPINFQIVFF